MASSYLQVASNLATGNTYTFSCWFKRTKLGTDQRIVSFPDADNNNEFINLNTTDNIALYNGGSGFSTSTRKLRDICSWYHLCFHSDAGSTKLWLNGELLSTGSGWQSLGTDKFRVGRVFGGTDYFEGLMSHVYFIDGTAYDADVFGATDAGTGEWEIETSPSVSFGTYGWCCKLENRSDISENSSGTAVSVTANGTITSTEDSPSNSFATINAILKSYGGGWAALSSNGNTTFTATGNWNYQPTTIGVNKGKYYWEQKIVDINSNGGFGLVSQAFTTSNLENIGTGYSETTGVIMYWHDGTTYLNGVNSAFGAALSDGDIMGCALDLDSVTKTITFYQNDVSQGTVNLPVNMQSDFVYPCYMGSASSNPFIVSANFGNGYFGTTVITSEGTNASNNGKFEYDIKPVDATAISTTGLNA